MELLVDLTLTPIVGFLLAQIIKRLPAKIQLFLGSLIIAFIATLIGWIIVVSTFKPSFAEVVGQTVVGISAMFVVISLVTFFGINYFQARREKHVIQNQFTLASDLIRGYRFQKALDILATINDPVAREWEAILNDMIRHDPEFLQHLESI